MKNKIISILFFNGLTYCAPLITTINLLFTIQMLLLNIIAILLFITQPSLSVKETMDKEKSDKFSVALIIAGCIICQIFSVIEWACFRRSFHDFTSDTFTFLAITFIICGLILRISAIRTLGKYFTGTVQIQADQKIIQSGVYKFIRHPSYMGAYLVMVGNAILLHAYIGICISLVAMFAVYYFRIKVEETELIKNFGAQYSEYKKRTKKLIPYIY
ncbi:MAG: isoprenylcysteine carboxylmethyltransferase family protein [Fimbriimonadaceae bacterium]|nr:isoprenylcysteine carboxylmethyltransferase family protein [Chitinophagales bacterium]